MPSLPITVKGLSNQLESEIGSGGRALRTGRAAGELAMVVSWSHSSAGHHMGGSRYAVKQDDKQMGFLQ